MSIFDTWRDVNVTNENARRSSSNKDIIKFRKEKSGYYRLSISTDLIKESGATRFSLKFNPKGPAYALVPDDNGPIWYNKHLNGISSVAIKEIANKLSADEVQGCVFDGAIVFPKSIFA